MRHAHALLPCAALLAASTACASLHDASGSSLHHNVARGHVHVDGRAQPLDVGTSNKRRDGMHKVVKKRQNIFDAAQSFAASLIEGADAPAQSATAEASTDAAAADETTAANLRTTAPARAQTSAAETPDPVASTTPAAAVTTTTTSPPAPVTTTTPAQTTRAAVTTTPPAQRSSAVTQNTEEPSSSSLASSSAPSVLTITSTSQMSSGSSTATSSSASASASAAKKDSDSGSSGISKPALIAIIVAASCVAIILVSWTIFRKVVFSPSRRFEKKLAPIEFRPDDDPYGNTSTDNILAGGLQHGRSASVRSAAMSERYNAGYAGSLVRSGSDKSSLRGLPRPPEGQYPMSIPYNGPGYAPQPYHGGSPYGNAQPGYPSELAYGGYGELQRGPSARSELSRLPSVNGLSSQAYAGPPAYNYPVPARTPARPW